MKNENMMMSARGNALNSVIENCVYTDAHGVSSHVELGMEKFMEQLIQNRDHGGAMYLIGNGGSAAVVSHAITDYTNVCRIRAFTLHESSLITCLANDFGYENAYTRLVGTVMRPGDILIAVSSSGKSLNICNAAKKAAEMGGIVITLSGFHSENPLRKLGDMNFWLDSNDYGLVEIAHLFILHNISDRIGLEMKKVAACTV